MVSKRSSGFCEIRDQACEVKLIWCELGHGASQGSGGRGFGGIREWTCGMWVSRGKRKVREMLQRGEEGGSPAVRKRWSQEENKIDEYFSLH